MLMMELHTGKCDVCNSENLILNSQDSEKYNKLIRMYFLEELDNSLEADLNFSLCPKCIYHITLLNLNKNYFLPKEQIENSECNNKCKLCMEDLDILSVHDAAFLDKCKPLFLNEDGVTLCARCFYLMDVRNTLKNHLREKLSRKHELQDTTRCEHKGLMSRRKSNHEKRNNGHQILEKNSETSTSHFTSFEIGSTPVPNKRRRSNNLEVILDENSKNSKGSCEKRKQSNIYTKDELRKFNFMNIMKFSPLCDSTSNIAEDLKSDEKIYNCVPFVKIEHLNETSAENDHCNYVCSLVPQRPMIRVRRTPPIKIKTIKNLFPLKNKTKVQKRKGNDRTSKSSSMEEISKKNLIVKVERMKLPLEERPVVDISACKSENSNEVKKSKRKKHVHFNDTPTIIITDDIYGDDYEEKKNESNKNHYLRSIMVTDKMVVPEDSETIDDLSDNDESITLSLEPDDDEESIVQVEETPRDDSKDGKNPEYGQENEMETGEKEVENYEGVENRMKNNNLETLCHIDNETEDGENKIPEQNNHEKNNLKEAEEVEVTIVQDGKIIEENVSESSSCKISQMNSESEESIHLFVDGDSVEIPRNEAGTTVEIRNTDKGLDKNVLEDDKDSLEDFQFDSELNYIDKSSISYTDPTETSSLQPVEEKDELNEACNDKEKLNEKDELNEACNDKEKLNEKDSCKNDFFKGFIVIDQDESCSTAGEGKSSVTKGISELEEEIDLLVKKYCDDDSKDKEKSDKNIVQANEKNTTEKTTEGEYSKQVIDTKENKSKCLLIEHMSEDFGSLIDEVQECLLTSSSDKNVNEKKIPNKLEIDAGNAELMEILEDSFGEALPEEENENIKRKYLKNEINEEEFRKKLKMNEL